VAATLCPQNDAGQAATATEAAPVWLRMRLFLRETQPVTGPWELTGSACVPVGADSGSQPSLLELAVRQWRRVEIPVPGLQVQPPGGRTLVNLDTIVFTDGAPREWPVRLLGRDVTIRAIPVSYRWRFGDGENRVTDDPGAAYPAQTVWHVFTEPGPTWASVDVTYRGEFQVDGAGGWIPIPGRVTRPGTPVALTVVEQRTELVAGG
jgi:hypothetical protein